MYTDTERCVRAVQSKDARFDGWFFTAVLTTGIYCRPSCPAVPPKPANMVFHPSAAACQQAGFRACKRCRPDTSPGSPEWNQRADACIEPRKMPCSPAKISRISAGSFQWLVGPASSS
ncbi:Ada metal-binding domain-containing protein, partial [Streptomyces albidoflavus]|uniref:Ada metal-binding domain-containing protein n=1 Tax=Streptomyces albidoflavus TaxID=1886 RepID=UPI0033A79EF0